MNDHRRALGGDFWLSCGIVLVGLLFMLGTLQVEEGSESTLIGPRFYPLLVSLGLLVTGAVLLREALQTRHIRPALEEPAAKPAYQAFVYISVGLILHMLLIQTLGFVVASVALFLCAARGFGAGNRVLTAGIGIALSLAAYSGFRYGLEIELPGLLAGFQ